MSTKIFHNKYIRDWMRAFPIGNGRVGGMVYGDPDTETVEINEESLWSGRQLEENYVTDKENLEKIRKLLFAEDFVGAEQLCNATLLATPPRVRFYESFGEIFVDFEDKSQYSDYRKELELADAIASVSYKKGGIGFKRTGFCSNPAQVTVIKYESEKNDLDMSFSLKRGRYLLNSYLIGDDITVIDGTVSEGGIRFVWMAKVVCDGDVEGIGERVCGEFV